MPILNRLFRRKVDIEGNSPSPNGKRPAKPTLWERITAFFVAIWNWVILVSAIVGAFICGRLAIGFWMSAEELQGGSEPLFFRLMAGAAAAAAVFLLWQIVRGVRYLRHRRRQKQEAPQDNSSLWRD